MDPKPHPIDFDRLQRGHVVAPEEISEAYGHEPGTRAFRFAQMGLRELIQRYFSEFRGDVVSISCTEDSIRILTHQEQDEYVQRNKRRAVRSFAIRHREDMGTDPAQLTADSSARRERRLILDGWKIQQLRKRARPELTP